MRTSVLLLPGALEQERQSPLIRDQALLRRFSLNCAEMMRVSSANAHSVNEWIGLHADGEMLSEGVLHVAALGVDPPDRSVHFILSILSTDGQNAVVPSYIPDAFELRKIFKESMRLETQKLKMIEGVHLQNALVWENGSTELQCTAPKSPSFEMKTSLPQGEGENSLRRLIDDSINLLTEMESNKIRQEEGLEPLNMLWPWGPGFRPRLPNLTLERGASVQVESPSSSLKGLCRLVGYRHGDPWELGAGTNLKLEKMAASLRNVPVGLGVIPTIGDFRATEQHEEAAWLGNEVFERLLTPLIPDAGEEPARIVLIATQQNGKGLALDYRSVSPCDKSDIPFSAEALEEKALPRVELNKLIAEALTAA